ncbi:hypothetical protein EVAR_65091_1 [Eumeta japonica]|uniref:Reverse transcriptase domain-containing protein n=1 Tax=Eumeta variegata TaxID=151549 RepID=A0A4C1Z4B0_EUMVA|nr:hypothetical protein EVAR_65091_1 [Eumeta japonica]
MEVMVCCNKYMGGVDLLDQRKPCYEVDRKAKIKYYLRLFFDILHKAKNNSYLVHVKLYEAHRVEGPLLSSLEYSQHIARGLINNFTCRQRSRPTLVSSERLHIGNKSNLPAHNMQKAKTMKKFVNCAKRRIENRTYNKCVMCNVYLGFTIMDGCLHNMKEHECGLKMDDLSVKCFLYADDLVILTSLACELQETITKMNDSVKKRGRKVNVSAKLSAMLVTRDRDVMMIFFTQRGNNLLRNYRPNMFFSHAYKLFSKININQFTSRCEEFELLESIGLNNSLTP